MNDFLRGVIHFFGTYPLLIGFGSELFVLYGAWKRQEKAEIVQAVLLMAALGLIGGSILLRPPSPPSLMADLLGCAGAAFLLAPGVGALRKIFKSKEQEDEPEDAGTRSEAEA